jgi:two-component system CheB/CheR fusion protein
MSMPAVTTPVVGIGASAGGLEAVSQLLHKLGPDLPFAWVVLQHVSPTHKSLLPEILARETRLQVRSMQDNDVPEAGVVYVVPPNSNAAVKRRSFQPVSGPARGVPQAVHQ